MQRGKLTLITGPMFSGKTTDLVNQMRILEQHGRQRVILFKPTQDTRRSRTAAVTEDGLRMRATLVSAKQPEGMLQHILEKRAEIVGVDEVQFFNTRLAQVIEDILEFGCDVIAAGIDLDFRREPLATTALLLALADEVVKRTARCECGASARFSQRFTKDGVPAPYHAPTFQVGGKRSYRPRCGHCHEVPGRPRAFTISSTPPAH